MTVQASSHRRRVTLGCRAGMGSPWILSNGGTGKQVGSCLLAAAERGPRSRKAARVPARPAADGGSENGFLDIDIHNSAASIRPGWQGTPAGDEVGRRVPAVVRRVEMMSRDVARIWHSSDEPFHYFPGQFVNVARGDGLVRSYSLASLHSPPGLPPGDPTLELHVRRVAGARMKEINADAFVMRTPQAPPDTPAPATAAPALACTANVD